MVRIPLLTISLVFAVAWLPTDVGSQPLGATDSTSASANAADGSAPAHDAEVVARINDDKITIKRFKGSYVRHLIQTGENDTPQQRFSHLNDLIDTYLLAEVARDRGLEDADYQSYIDLEIRKVVGGRYFEVAFADSLPDPSEAEVREAFRRTNEKVILRHLFFRTSAEARAARNRLQNGADFVELANEIFETSRFDSTAGTLGAAEYWDLDDAVAEAAWPLQVGEYSEPVRSRYGWHILRVEDRLRNPILTADAFERRREDLAHRVRARRFRLDGSRFVRAFMDSLDVDVNVEAMSTLRTIVIRELAQEDAPQMPRTTLESEEVAVIKDDFSGESTLATYVFDGVRRVFTAADYFEWLGHLPYDEVRHRTAASVGRALRNQVLAERGLTMGLHNDPIVLDEIEYRASAYLAAALRNELRREPDVVPTESDLREAYERLGYGKLENARADYWHIKFDVLAAAEEAKSRIESGDVEPSAFAQFETQSGADLTSTSELNTYIRTAPLKMPVIVGVADDEWHVLRVDDRSIEYNRFEDVRHEIEATVGPFLPEIHLLRALREKANIEIDLDLLHG